MPKAFKNEQMKILIKIVQEEQSQGDSDSSSGFSQYLNLGGNRNDLLNY